MGIADVVAKYQEAKKLVEAEVRANFSTELDAAFRAHPKLQEVSWTQYTPYFNDGDTCTFGVNMDDLSFKFEGIEALLTDDAKEDYAERGAETWGLGRNWEKRLPDLEAGLDAVSNVLAAVPEEFYKEMFGDHVRVTAKLGSIDVSEYGHD